MPLTPGVRLGPYEVVGLIGAGGMGEVYKARDTRLDRTVALKVLPAAYATEPTQRARFEREARAISALEHPHICTLHDVGEEEGRAYLVMEHLAGETLSERLKKGPLPLHQAIELGVQIAEALAAAHQHGIVHRDLKPANVMLTKTGAKLLDFGLARLGGEGPPAVVIEHTSTPTEAAPLTTQGTIVGTVPYMAPEQLEGQPADARTDLWSLGAILHEMVTGRRPFEAPSHASLIAAILERDPAPLATLQPLTPPPLERLVRRCLAKSPDDRWDTAHDVAEELRWIRETGSEASSPTAGRAAGTRRTVLAAGVLTVAAASALLGALVGRRLWSPAVPPPLVVRSLLDVRPAEELYAGGQSAWQPTPGGARTALVWTPDGRSLVFVGRRGGVQQLYVRALGAPEARPLEGTEGAQAPAVSPDGQWVAFWARDAIRRVPLSGGPVGLVVETGGPPPTGLACGENGLVFFDGVDRVLWSAQPERPPTRVTTLLESELSHGLPHLLPGGRALLFTASHRGWTSGDEEVVAQVIATGERKRLVQDGSDARYVAPGHLVFLRQGVLLAAPFDPVRLEVTGTPAPVLDSVAQALTSGFLFDVTRAGQFAASSTGALAFVPGGLPAYRNGELVAVDRQGRLRRLDVPVHSYLPGLGVSPDDRRLVVTVQTLGEQALWLYDRDRGLLTRLPGGGESNAPKWTPDDQRVAFSWLNGGRYVIAWQRTDGSAGPEVLAGSTGSPSSWSPDGRQLAISKEDDIWMASIDGDRASLAPLTRTPEAQERWPEFSPDGRWLAYAANNSGQTGDVRSALSRSGPAPAGVAPRRLEPRVEPHGPRAVLRLASRHRGSGT